MWLQWYSISITSLIVFGSYSWVLCIGYVVAVVETNFSHHDLLGCTSGVLSPYNLKIIASKPQSIVLETVTCNHMFSKGKAQKYFQNLFFPLLQ
jgi:hypothetical protein